ncbi:MAG: glycosyltransferase family 9 protein [Flavisolibacter sp.]
MKFLVIRFSSIGDIVLTTPVVRCLKKQIESAEIHYLVKPQFQTILAHNPYIDAIQLLQEDWEKMIRELKDQQYDYVIDLHHNLRTLRVKRALGLPSFSFNKLNVEKLVFVKLKWNIMPKVHIIDRYLQTIASFGVKNDGEGMDYFIAKDEEVSLKDIPASHHAGYVALVIGASYKTKKLPLDKLQQLCKAVQHPIILLGAREEAEEGASISSVDPGKIYNACGKFTLNESADLLLKSRVVITHDTGLMHIAAALKKPLIAIWGSTTPSFGMVPYYGAQYLAHHGHPYDDIQVHKLWCRPCTKIGRNACPLGHFKCMKKISIEEIVQNLNKRLKN